MFAKQEMTQYLQLMKSLPPLVSIVVWDAVVDHIDELTIQLAQAKEARKYHVNCDPTGPEHCHV